MLGSWLEGGRVAALRGDRAYFQRPESQAIAAAMGQLPRLSRDERAALERVRALVMDDALQADAASLAVDETRADLAALEEALTGALVLLAR